MLFIKKNWTYILGALLGVLGGYLYWRFVGCSSGSCPITSSPLMSSLYGLVIGSLIGGLFKAKEKR